MDNKKLRTIETIFIDSMVNDNNEIKDEFEDEEYLELNDLMGTNDDHENSTDTESAEVLDLGNWSTKFNIPQGATDALLKLLNKGVVTENTTANATGINDLCSIRSLRITR